MVGFHFANAKKKVSESGVYLRLLFKVLQSLLVTGLMSTLFAGPGLASTSRQNQTVAATQTDARPCQFFYLNGVAVADSVVPGQPWFAIPSSNPNFAVMVSTLMSSKLSGKPIDVQTDGTVSCGFATVYAVGLSQ